MILERNNLKFQEWNKFYIELIVLYVHSKIAIMFDHSRLGLENKFFPNKLTQSLTTLILILFFQINADNAYIHD